MKKTISLILVLSVIAAVFSACGEKDMKERIRDVLTTNDSTYIEEENNGENESQSEALLEPAEKETQIEAENFTNELIIKGKIGANTPTGFSPLDLMTYPVKDAYNENGLSTQKKSHSHGPASGGQPHHTVVSFQDEFDKYDALTLDRKSEGKVLYLTFDCGYEYNNLTAKVLDTLKEKGVPATFFCTLDHIKKEEELITRMIKEGHIVGNHSANHPSYAEIDRTTMAIEIEETENYLREKYGYASKFFRFPKGEYTESALDLVASLGYKTIFWSVAYNDWNTDNIQGKDYAVKTVTERLHNGAVILLHSVSQDNADALSEIIDKARAEGYEFKALTDYPFEK